MKSLINYRFKILFFMALFTILILSITPHPQSEVTQQVATMQTELVSLGSVAYMGEELLGSFSDKYRHLLAFWTLALLLDLAYGFKTVHKLFFLLIYGSSIEILQYFVPYRDFDIYDLIFNTFFIGTYFLFSRIIFRNYYSLMLGKLI